MSKNGPLALSFHALVVIFMMAPLVVVCLVASPPKTPLPLPTPLFPLRCLKAVSGRAVFIVSFNTTLLRAFVPATLAPLIAVPAALAITRHTFPGRNFFNALFLSPIIIPHLVLGVAMLRLFALMGVNGSFTWLIFAHVLVITPYVLRLVLAAAIGIDRSAEHAAESLGADRFTLFRQITLPMILPGVAGGWLLAFINSFDEVTLSIFVTSPATQTLPVRMYVYATESIDPMMAAVSALVIALTAATMILLDRVYGLDRVLVGKH
ncbi:ABC transporter permease [Pseudomonas syringae]|uniref:ABC transporter permease n=1 Tax=Pseudomonas syringae TaxID=317 RepID=UPI001F2C9392|nr:ABC transporter permease [Pseudomonas syringae]MCF5421977.1 ABC transporter permease subunit [Pseudomonas syringae]